MEIKGLEFNKQPFTKLEIIDETSGNKEQLKVAAMESAPRLGFIDHFRVVQASLNAFNIPLVVTGGAWWEHAIQNTLVQLIQAEVDIIITLDYDSIFFPEDLELMLSTMVRNPEIDALVPIQLKRGNKNDILTGIEGVNYYAPCLTQKDITKIDYGHFGLTLFRAKMFKDIPKPWLLGVPNADGDWFNGQVNADIYFWKKLKEYNKQVYMANQVRIGHIDEYMIILDHNNDIKRYKLNDYMLGNFQRSLGD